MRNLYWYILNGYISLLITIPFLFCQFSLTFCGIMFFGSWILLNGMVIMIDVDFIKRQLNLSKEKQKNEKEKKNS